ncbi:MAG TPA: MFS transporter [Candidatus Saccharimonadales bacterium]|jgi:EmrB/QacA subfamily drug resistance transporter
MEMVKHKGFALATLATAQCMVILDATIVNVALPTIQKSLHFTNDAQLQWIVTAYALTFGGFLLLGGRLADLFGRRRIFLTGVVAFAIFSLGSGLTQSPGQLIAFRALQGLAGAILAPSALAIVLTIFKEGKERNRAIGIWSMVAAGGGAIGLLLGGILTQYANWRWIFFINIFIGIAVFTASMKYVPKITERKKQKIDYVGGITSTGGLISLVYALSVAPTDGWTGTSTLIALALFVVLMGTFIVNELRVEHPLVKLSIFRRRNVSGGSLIQILVPASMYGMFFYLSIYLQQILHYSPTRTGLADVPFTIVLIIVAGYLSRRLTKINPKLVVTIAPLIVAAGLVIFSRIAVHSHYLSNILPGVIVMSIGVAAVFVTATIVTTSGSTQEESGLISGLINTGQQVGGAIGLAVLSVISTTVTKNDMAKAHGNPADLLSATVHGFQRGFLVATVFAVAASIIALTVLKTHKPTTDEVGRETEIEAESLPAIPGV